MSLTPLPTSSLWSRPSSPACSLSLVQQTPRPPPPFDDVYGPVNLFKPIATRCTNLGRGWAILGTNNNIKQQLDTMKFRILNEKLGNSVEYINLGSCSGDGAGINGTEWKRVVDLPAPVSQSPTCLVLCGKLYCLSGFTQRGSQYRMAAGAKRPWAMAYDPSVEKWEPLPDPGIILCSQQL